MLHPTPAAVDAALRAVSAARATAAAIAADCHSPDGATLTAETLGGMATAVALLLEAVAAELDPSGRGA